MRIIGELKRVEKGQSQAGQPTTDTHLTKLISCLIPIAKQRSRRLSSLETRWRSSEKDFGGVFLATLEVPEKQVNKCEVRRLTKHVVRESEIKIYQNVM